MTGRSIALLLLTLLFASAAHGGVRVEVEGLGSDERDNVMARLAIRQQSQRDDLNDAMVERLHDQRPPTSAARCSLSAGIRRY